jgi:two-component system NtrC family sensor kinase
VVVASRPRVLVVDDQPDIGRAIERVLRPVAQVSVERAAVAALERVRRGERFDLIVCDVVMPHTNGPELFDRVVACAPEMRDAFVFVSGGMDGPVARHLKATGRPCLEKPLSVKSLRDLLSPRAEGEP